MSDGQLDIEFKFNTQQAKRDADDVRKATKTVGDEAKAGNKSLQEREGIVERLKRRMSELGQDQEKAMSVASVARINREMQIYGNELARVTRAGKQGFDANGVAMISNEGILQRLQRAASLYQKGMYEATRPDNLEKYSQKLALVNAEMSKLTKGSNIGGSGWNGLQNSINQISRELPAFTYSVQTGFMAISNNIPIFVDEVNRLRQANAALNAEGKKGIPVWKQIASSLFSWQTAMSLGITLLTVYGKEIGEWIGALFKGKNALEELRKANEDFKATRLKGAQDARRELVSLESLYRATQNTALSVIERKKAVDALQSQYPRYFKNLTDEQILAGKAASSYDKLRQSIIGAARARAYQDKIAELASKKLENEDKIIDNASTSMKLERESKSSQSALDKMSPGSNAYSAQVNRDNAITNEIEAKKILINDLNKANASIDKEMMRYQKGIDNLVQTNGTDVLTGVGGKDQAEKKIKDVSNLYNQISNASRDFLNKLGDLDKEYARKSMESDEAELQALKDKFAKLRRELEIENDKIADANKKNAGKKGYKAVDLIDVSKVAPIEKKAIEDLTYTQQTKSLQREIEKQKQIFVDYESYKAKLGQEKADERFKADLKGFENYKQYIDSVSKSQSIALNAVDNKTATAGQQDRAKIINKESDDAKREEERKQTDLLALMITYDQRRKNLIKIFETERVKLVSEATVEELKEFDRKHIEELNTLDDSHIQQLASYKNLFEGIHDLSDAAARKVITDAKIILSANKDMSADERKKIEKAIKQAEQSMSDRLPDRLNAVSQEFSNIASDVGKVNEELGTMLSLVSEVLRSVAQIDKGFDGLKKGLDNWKKTKNDPTAGILDKVSAIAGVAGPAGQIVSAVAGVVSGIVGFFNAAKESARLAKEEMKKYQFLVLTGELEYNRLLRSRARQHADINSMSLDELKTQQALLETQLKLKQAREITTYKKNPTFNDIISGAYKSTQTEMLSDYEFALRKVLLEGQQITGQKTEKYGGVLGIGKKTRVVDITADLAGKTYEDLEKLYTEGKLTESSKALFENLKKAKEEIDDINELMKQIDEVVKDKMSGGVTASSISSSIIQGFKDGKRALVDFADSAEEIIQNALLSAMSATVLEAPLMELVKKFREDSKDGLSQSEIEAFKKGYGEIVQSGIEALKEVEKLTGKTVGSGNGSIQGRINRTVSEDTASAILGFERSRYDLAKLSYATMQKAIDFDSKSYDLLLDQLKVQKSIEQNTATTVTELKNAVVELKAINKNTTTQSTRAYGG